MKTKINAVSVLTTALAAIGLMLTGATLMMAQSTGTGIKVDSSRPHGPCDIYAAAGDPCVAAHSTTRALYASYNGPLYQEQGPKRRPMNRRSFLAGSACALGALVTHRLVGEEASVPLRIDLDVSRTLGRIPVDFTGLGYEISSVAIPSLLTPANNAYIQLARTLGRHGVIRIGGNTSDYSTFDADGRLVSAPKATVINSESLRRFGRFLDATGWKLIWGLNLGSGTEQRAVQEAQAVATAVGNKLLAFQIGNEPDLFVHEGHRPPGYGYAQYLQEYRRYKAAIRAKLPAAPFAGPDVALATAWAVRFAKDEGRDLALLTHHYYRGGASNPKSTLQELLAPDPKLSRMLEAMRAASQEARIAYRIVETNSFSGGGKRGVSNTFRASQPGSQSASITGTSFASPPAARLSSLSLPNRSNAERTGKPGPAASIENPALPRKTAGKAALLSDLISSGASARIA